MDYTDQESLLIKLKPNDGPIHYMWHTFARHFTTIRDLIEECGFNEPIPLDMTSTDLSIVIKSADSVFDSVSTLNTFEEKISLIQSCDYLGFDITSNKSFRGFSAMSDAIFGSFEEDGLVWTDFYKWANQQKKSLYNMKDAITVLEHFRDQKKE